jgi:hypothetical protein
MSLGHNGFWVSHKAPNYLSGLTSITNNAGQWARNSTYQIWSSA